MGFYEHIMKLAVQIKRVVKGNHAQTTFTRNLEKIQFKSPEELKALQAVCLCELLNHAVENIPFYKELKDKFKLIPETVFDDIKQFPILTKAILNENRENLIAPDIDIIGKLESSGTMGEISIMLQDKYTETHAPDEFFNKKIGVVPGKCRIILKSVKKKNEKAIGEVEYEFDRIARSYLINYRYINDARYKFMTKTWLHKKPKIIWGSTQAVCSLAAYMEANKIEVNSPELVLVGGQTMLPQWKNKIENVWKTNVFDRYGSVEVGNMANQCKMKDGYHYVPTVHYVEVLDENLQPVAEGETGSIYITTLSKRALPVIRYKQDDLVEYTERTCECGCNFPIIGKIFGKRREGIISPKLSYVALSPINKIITGNNEIKDFQVIQVKTDSLHIRLVENKPVTNDTLKEIENNINTILDYKMKVTFEKVDSIKVLPNGKMLRIIPIDRKEILNETI